MTPSYGMLFAALASLCVLVVLTSTVNGEDAATQPLEDISRLSVNEDTRDFLQKRQGRGGTAPRM